MDVTSTTQTDYTAASTTVKNDANTTTSTSFADELTQEMQTETATAQNNVQKPKTNEEIIAEYRAMPGGNGIAYEGMFEEMVADFTTKHEAEFKQTYEFYEKYKDVFTPKYSNYTREKADSISRELKAQFPDYKAVHFKAYHGGTEEDKKKFEAMLMDYQAFNKYLHKKYDLDMGLGMSYTPEGARAYNFAVYEKLESGASISEATQYAGAIAATFGGNEGNAFQMMGLMGYPDSMEEAMKTPEAEKETNYDRQIDLREYGIDHNFNYTNYDMIFGTDKEGIKRRISYQLDLFGFLTTHESIVNGKIEELKEKSPKWFEFANSDGKYASNLKEGFKNSYEVAKFAKTIFDKYADKIFTKDTSKAQQSTEELLKSNLKQSDNIQTKSNLEKVLQEVS